MDEEHLDLIVCHNCERPTCEPPDELLEFKGLCPGCVIKQEVLPLLPKRFADLVDSILESRDDALMEHILGQLTGRGGVAIVIGTDDLDRAGADAMADKVMEVFKHIIMHDKEARNRLRDVIDLINTQEEKEGLPVKLKKPKTVIHNDPRTS